MPLPEAQSIAALPEGVPGPALLLSPRFPFFLRLL